MPASVSPLASDSVIESSPAVVALVESARLGDESAFESLASIYKRVLEFYISRIAPNNPSDHDDLFQEGLIGLMRAVRGYNGDLSSFSTFASHCIRNSIVSAVRRNATQLGKSFACSEPISENEASPSPEELLIDKLSASLVYSRIVDNLSDYEARVFELYLSDMSYESIAFVTGKSVKSINNAIFRIRNKLKKVILR